VQPDTHPLRANSLATAPINGEVATAEVEDEHIKVNGVTDIRLNVFEKARTVTSVCTSGTLCTVSSHQGIEGSPFGSFVDYVLDDNGLPVLLMNDMSMHTINIERAAQEEGAPMVAVPSLGW
jgi:Pyridoxamine 5'-phosphate oxidase